MYIDEIESPLAQGRGLKLLDVDEERVGHVVASRAGAWIETCRSSQASPNITGRLSRRARDRSGIRMSL
jgi:hypothetical protein